jgi:hypothetical protein
LELLDNLRTRKLIRGQVFISEQNKCMSQAYHHVTTTFKYKIEPDRTYLALNLTLFFTILSYDNQGRPNYFGRLKQNFKMGPQRFSLTCHTSSIQIQYKYTLIKKDPSKKQKIN